jgi:death-on-curing protein
VDPIDFLDFDDVVAIHADQLAVHGGRDGFVDEGVVRSAVAQPQASMFGNYLHQDLAEMAAAYLFHLAASQGFVDGNKRTAVVAAVEFLGRNGYDLDCSDLEVYDVTMRIANHQASKEVAADWLRQRIRPFP